MASIESFERKGNQQNALAEGSTEITSIHNHSAVPATPIKKTRLFSLVNSPAATAATRSGSTQHDFIASSFHTSKNLDVLNPFSESDYPSQRFRPETYEEEDLEDPYYSPPSTFIPPESPNDLKVEDQNALAVLSSETEVRDYCFSMVYTDI